MIVRPTIRGEARQVHPADEEKCNCHQVIKWAGRGMVIGEGLEIDDCVAFPGDWVVRIGDEVRVVRATDFPLCYEEMTDEESV